MSKFTVVIADYDYDIVASEVEILNEIGAEVVTAHCKTEEEVIEVAKHADGIICQYAPISRKVIDSLLNCKVVARYGIGFDTIDVKAATEKGIFICNVTDYCWDEVSDHAFALLIVQARKIVQQDRNVKDGVWDFKAGLPINRLRGQVLGLVGFGNIPQTLAKKAQAFGLKVISYDPFVPVSVASNMGVELVGLEMLCQQSDFISVHTPLNKSTRGMIGKEQFAQMKKNAFIINTARGPIIEEQTLIAALNAKEIAGAGLDVLEDEPISLDNPLRNMENVILNPHISYYSSESVTELKRKTARNIVDVLIGYYPSYIVNKELKEYIVLADK